MMVTRNNWLKYVLQHSFRQCTALKPLRDYIYCTFAARKFLPLNQVNIVWEVSRHTCTYVCTMYKAVW